MRLLRIWLRPVVIVLIAAGGVGLGFVVESTWLQIAIALAAFLGVVLALVTQSHPRLPRYDRAPRRSRRDEIDDAWQDSSPHPPDASIDKIPRLPSTQRLPPDDEVSYTAYGEVAASGGGYADDDWLWDAPPPRFTNVVLRSSEGERPVIGEFGSCAVIEVDIGPLLPDSDVYDPFPVPFPNDVLPREDLSIAVLLSSAELGVGHWGDNDPEAAAVEQGLLLPGDGSPSRPADGGDVVRFNVRLPAAAGRARARLSYLYRDTVVQSQRLTLTARDHTDTPGACEARLTVETDFTLSRYFGADLADVVPRRRVSVVVNANSADEHEVTVRSPLQDGQAPPPVAFRINHGAAAKVVGEMREGLKDRAPRVRERGRDDLRDDLRRLAPIGWRLYTQLDPGGRRMIESAGTDTVVQVAMPRESGFTMPWNLVYDIFLDSQVDPRDFSVCRIVDELGDGSTVVGFDTQQCPYASDRSHAENMLCPFGFWGYRHSFELLASSDRPKSTVVVDDGARIVVAQTQRNIDRDELKAHVDSLSELFKGYGPGVMLKEAHTKAEVRAELSSDLPFVYFLCHGAKSSSGATLLGVGDGETIEPADIDGWVETVYRTTERKIWTEPQPLVFINACQSLAIDPQDLRSYLNAFVGTAQAAGVIGTEARVDQDLAMEVGEEFFRRLLVVNATVDDALRHIKTSFLSVRNLIGLVYTPYCFADLRVEQRSA